MSYTLSNDDINTLTDAMERPTKRTQLAITAIRELQHKLSDWRRRADLLSARAEKLEADVRGLRAGQDPNTVEGLKREVARLNALLDDKHAQNAQPTADDTERRIREAYEAGRSGETFGHP